MRVFKRILIALAAIIGVIVLAGGLYLLKINSETKKMHPNDTKELVQGVYSIKDSFVNMYLIKSNGFYVAVDAGVSQNNVAGEMKKENIDPQKVAAVLLTHTDSDHIGAIKLFKNAKVFISSAEEQMINGKTVRSMLIFKNKLSCTYQTIDDNQTLDVGGLKVKGILSPGHTPGSMSYIINDKYIFTGDNLSLKNGKAELFNDFYNIDSDTQKKTIHKLAGLEGIKYIFTGHYGYCNDFASAFR